MQQVRTITSSQSGFRAPGEMARPQLIRRFTHVRLLCAATHSSARRCFVPHVRNLTCATGLARLVGARRRQAQQLQHPQGSRRRIRFLRRRRCRSRRRHQCPHLDVVNTKRSSRSRCMTPEATAGKVRYCGFPTQVLMR